MTRRAIVAAVAIACVMSLSACSFLARMPGSIFASDDQVAEAMMSRIAAAVKARDAAALEELFAPRALENAAELDDGLAYFLSIFPAGEITWESSGISSTKVMGNFKSATLLFGHYDISVGGEELVLYFPYVPANDWDSEAVGIYALGAVPPDDWGYEASGDRKPFPMWCGQFDLSERPPPEVTGEPGVYIPQP